jgi:hypothetical protein
MNRSNPRYHWINVEEKTVLTRGMLLLIVVCLSCNGLSDARSQEPKPEAPTLKVANVVKVDKVFTGIPVGFDLLTHGKYQFVAYYDPDRQLTVAVRQLGSETWERVKLDETNPWDSHNDITMAVDRNGHLHLSGNMHGVPLNYYRTGPDRTFKQLNEMVGKEENSVTYPHFLKGPKGRLIFSYRDGGSGNGRRLYNVYDAEQKEWKRLLDRPLLDGTSQGMNAYPHGPKQGPNGNFHIAWMWRNTPDAATNHDISYMWSPDLKHWKTAGGEPLSLPVTPENKKVVVDPVPPGEGLINMGYGLGFDHRGRPIVSYHKYDKEGNSQIYNARWEGNDWVMYKMTNWKHRWDFGGGGSIPGHVGTGSVRRLAPGKLAQPYHHWKKGSGTWLLDAKTLRPIGKTTTGYQKPDKLNQVRSDFPGMRVHWTGDSGSSGHPRVRYELRWETLGVNRDRKRTGDLPEPSTLEVYKFIEPGR